MPGRLLALLLLLCACDPTYLDEDWIVAEDGTELHPGAMPVTVSAEDDCADVAGDAIAWWGGELGVDAFVARDDGYASVALGLVPDAGDINSDGEPLGHASIEYSAWGSVLSCDVTLSSDIAYHGETLVQVARHELGHCLGLADDPGPPTTVDLRSVMASPLDPLGILTDHDRALLAPYLEGL